MCGVKGKSGRKPLSQHRQNTIQLITETSPKAAAYLRGVITGDEEPNTARIDACKYIINQDLGMPKQRQELSGPDGGAINLSWAELVRGASERSGKTNDSNPL